MWFARSRRPQRRSISRLSSLRLSLRSRSRDSRWRPRERARSHRCRELAQPRARSPGPRSRSGRDRPCAAEGNSTARPLAHAVAPPRSRRGRFRDDARACESTDRDRERLERRARDIFMLERQPRRRATMISARGRDDVVVRDDQDERLLGLPRCHGTRELVVHDALGVHSTRDDENEG